MFKIVDAAVIGPNYICINLKTLNSKKIIIHLKYVCHFVRLNILTIVCGKTGELGLKPTLVLSVIII